jgi:hypothetical protein
VVPLVAFVFFRGYFLLLDGINKLVSSEVERIILLSCPNIFNSCQTSPFHLVLSLSKESASKKFDP